MLSKRRSVLRRKRVIGSTQPTRIAKSVATVIISAPKPVIDVNHNTSSGTRTVETTR